MLLFSVTRTIDFMNKAQVQFTLERYGFDLISDDDESFKLISKPVKWAFTYSTILEILCLGIGIIGIIGGATTLDKWVVAILSFSFGIFLLAGEMREVLFLKELEFQFDQKNGKTSFGFFPNYKEFDFTHLKLTKKITKFVPDPDFNSRDEYTYSIWLEFNSNNLMILEFSGTNSSLVVADGNGILNYINDKNKKAPARSF